MNPYIAIFNHIAAHKVIYGGAVAWFIREIPTIWSFLQDNGGLGGIKQTILCGKKQENEIENVDVNKPLHR